MKITKDTKISKILKAKPEAIDVIAGINTNFKKLQNPILRRSLATRVSVKDAARIGKTSVNDFLKALESIGFDVAYDTGQEMHNHDVKNFVPPDFSGKEMVTLDVRPIINEGKDPFGYINKVAKTIKPHQVLLIINDFEPIPLIDYLVGKNFVHWMTQDKAGNYLAYFKLNCKKPGLLQRLFGKKNIPCKYHDISKKNRQASSETTKKSISQKVTPDADFGQINKQFEGKMKEIDVRHLDMPMPMQTILENIEQMPENKALFVHHKRVPQFLIPELRKRNFKFVTKEINPDYTYLIVYKDQQNK
jgi:uncharacterized protein (DUF2249 family)